MSSSFKPFEQTFVPSSHRGSIWNLILHQPIVSARYSLFVLTRRKSTINQSIHMKPLPLIGPMFLRRKGDRRRRKPAYTTRKSSPVSLWFRWANKSKISLGKHTEELWENDTGLKHNVAFHCSDYTFWYIRMKFIWQKFAIFRLHASTINLPEAILYWRYPPSLTRRTSVTPGPYYASFK